MFELPWGLYAGVEAVMLIFLILLILELLADAICECAVNAVKHANGDTVFVEIDGNTALLTNNGSSPKGLITESGGSLALRQRTEAAGGTMIVQYQPAFSLMIRFP